MKSSAVSVWTSPGVAGRARVAIRPSGSPVENEKEVAKAACVSSRSVKATLKRNAAVRRGQTHFRKGSSEPSRWEMGETEDFLVFFIRLMHLQRRGNAEGNLSMAQWGVYLILGLRW